MDKVMAFMKVSWVTNKAASEKAILRIISGRYLEKSTKRNCVYETEGGLKH